LAKTVPDVTIFGICSKGKHEALKNAQSPVDHLLERGSDYSSEIRKISPDGVDIVLDCLCGEECNKGYSLLKPMGRYILYGSSNVVTGETKSFFSAARSWWQVDKVSPLKLFDENRTLSGFNLRRLLFQQGGTEFVEKAVQKVFSLLQEKKIKPLLDSTWALEDVAEAMQKMHDRKNVGKLILDPSLEPKPKPATPAKGKSKEDKKKQSSEEKKEDEKKEEEKKEEKKDEQLTNGDSAGDSGK
jgi:NADPH:quinone reductase-like Zn-dependent oxidoreductase